MLINERDAARAWVLELEDELTTVINDQLTEIVRLERRVETLEQSRLNRRLRVRAAGRAVVAALRTIADFIASRGASYLNGNMSRTVSEHVPNTVISSFSGCKAWCVR